MANKFIPENAVMTDPVVGEVKVTHDDGTTQVKNLHASGLTTAKGQKDESIGVGAAPAAQSDGPDEAAEGDE